jgi:membrane protein involved in colicin uptake
MLGPEECCWGVKWNPTREHQKGNEANSVLIFLLRLHLILFAILILILLFRTMNANGTRLVLRTI